MTGEKTPAKRPHKSEFSKKLEEGKARIREIPKNLRLTFEELKSSSAWEKVGNEQTPTPTDIHECVQAFARYMARPRKPLDESRQVYGKWKPYHERIKNRLNSEMEADDAKLAYGIYGFLVHVNKPSARGPKTSGKSIDLLLSPR